MVVEVYVWKDQQGELHFTDDDGQGRAGWLFVGMTQLPITTEG